MTSRYDPDDNWTGQICDCGHQRAAHEDRDGNKSWNCIEKDDCGIGRCFEYGCEPRCKEFSCFDLDVIKIRKDNKTCK